MLKKIGLTASIIGALSLAPARPALADDLGKALAIGVIGAIIAGAANDQAKAKQKSAPRQSAPQRSPAEVQAAKDLQAALNHFGFDAGAVDGQPGRKTKSAVASYQGTLGHPQTGDITDVERQLLLDSMARERLNPAEAMQLAAANPFGRSGLPAEYRRQAAMPLVAPVPIVAPAAPAPMVAPAAPAVDQAAMPSFGLPTEPTRSVNGHCNQINVLTTTNGGFSTAEAMPDPTLAMNEQFCLARTFAIAEGQKTAAQVGATQEQIATLCGQLKAKLEPKLAGLATEPPEAMIRSVRAEIDASGKSVQEMTVTGRICLSEAYRTDDPVAANAALVTLAAADQKPYAELVGHHLREGFAGAANTAAGKVWVKYALDAVAGGVAPAFLPGQAAERAAILNKALMAN